MRTFQAVPLHFKFAQIEQSGTFSGFASTYGGEPDSYGSVIARGAFTDSLRRHSEKNTRPALLWQHDMTVPIGIWQEFEDTPQGLVGHGKLSLDVPRAQDAYALMKDGALALSIGFNLQKGGAEFKDGVELLNKLDLIEVSLVSIPANINARIINVKCFDPKKPNPREFERAARDALGLSASEAKRLMSGGWSKLIARDEQIDDSKELAAIAAKLQRITNTLRGK